MVISNTLGNYDPIFYAQEALIQLHEWHNRRVTSGSIEAKMSPSKGNMIAEVTTGGQPPVPLKLYYQDNISPQICNDKKDMQL